MGLRKLAAIALAWIAAFSGGAHAAESGVCRALQNRLIQLQSGDRNAMHVQSTQKMLAACRGGGRSAAREIRKPAIKIPKAPALAARPAKRATPTGSRVEEAALSRPEASPPRPGKAKPRTKEKKTPPVARAAETFRTLCVRRCDGYYFPISYSTTREHFASDAEVCTQLCPAAKADLYFHDVDDGGPENMTALDGSPYTKLSAAFAYRAAVDLSCSCGLAQSPQRTADAAKPAAAGAAKSALLPIPRSQPGEDPETLVNRDGALDFTTRSAALASLDGEVGPSVRIVWPERPSEQAELVISEVPN